LFGYKPRCEYQPTLLATGYALVIGDIPSGSDPLSKKVEDDDDQAIGYGWRTIVTLAVSGEI